MMGMRIVAKFTCCAVDLERSLITSVSQVYYYEVDSNKALDEGYTR